MKTQTKNGKRSVGLEVKPQQAVETTQEHLEQRVGMFLGGREAEKEKLMEGIVPVFEYEYSDQIIGVGWREADKNWYDFELGLNVETGKIELTADVISLSDTLAWVEHMEFAADRIDGDPVQKREGYEFWIQELRSVVQTAGE